MERMNRRDFLGTAAAGTLALGGLTRSARAGDSDEPKLKLALIGCGNYGMAGRQSGRGREARTALPRAVQASVPGLRI